MLDSIAAMLAGAGFYHTAFRSGWSPNSWVPRRSGLFLGGLVVNGAGEPALKAAVWHDQGVMVRYAYILLGVASVMAFDLLVNKSASV